MDESEKEEVFDRTWPVTLIGFERTSNLRPTRITAVFRAEGPGQDDLELRLPMAADEARSLAAHLGREHDVRITIELPERVRDQMRRDEEWMAKVNAARKEASCEHE